MIGGARTSTHVRLGRSVAIANPSQMAGYAERRHQPLPLGPFRSRLAIQVGHRSKDVEAAVDVEDFAGDAA